MDTSLLGDLAGPATSSLSHAGLDIGAQDVDSDEDHSRPSFPPAKNYGTHLPVCPIDRPSEVIRAYVISGTERLYRVL
jgi:hypothetical protein